MTNMTQEEKRLAEDRERKVYWKRWGSWRDLILFYEYFNADNGAGLGASHQTGWTGLATELIQQFSEKE